MMPAVGDVFGLWTVTGITSVVRGRSTVVACYVVCSCGRTALTAYRTLRRGLSTKCRSCATRLHNTKHGLHSTPEYKSWLAMVQRCSRPGTNGYERYAGRGIVVCDRWLTIENFITDMGPRPPGMTLERINNGGNYEPGNCRWATKKEQGRNKRNNRMITVGERTQCLSAWAEESGIKGDTVEKRLNRGWPAERAVFEPVGSVQ